MGTGGRLTLLLERFTTERRARLDVVATAGWRPNAPVAREHLEPLGVHVEEHDPECSAPLPLPDDGARLVVNRQEALDAVDAARVMASGGILVTRQVDGTEVSEVHDWFGIRPRYPDACLAVVTAALRAAGLEVERPGSDPVRLTARRFRIRGRRPC